MRRALVTQEKDYIPAHCYELGPHGSGKFKCVKCDSFFWSGNPVEEGRGFCPECRGNRCPICGQEGCIQCARS